MKQYTVMLPAAGSGRRMGAGKNKLFLSLDGHPILAHTLQVFERDPFCKGMILAIKEEERKEMETLVRKYQLTKVLPFAIGGKERQHSVHACLEAFDGQEEEIVLVHDAARPFIREEVIHALVEKANEEGGAIAAVRAKDTTKVVERDVVRETIPRETLWNIQTPQAFRYGELFNASKKALDEGILVTDESMLFERLGRKVTVVESTYDNIKMTTQEDLAFGEVILRRKEEENDSNRTRI